MRPGVPKPPSWNDIQHLIDELDQVCRESERLRAEADRMLRRRDCWPHRPPQNRTVPDAPGDDSSSEGTDGTL